MLEHPLFDSNELEPVVNDPIYRVSELNAVVKHVLEKSFPYVWVEGEISNLAFPASGHVYFTLKDESAQIKCALFRGAYQAKRLALELGLRIRVRAKVTLYPERGDYQLIIERVELVGEGVLQRAFEKLKAKLLEEGLFDPRYKKFLPKFPKQIGVITSPTGAAIRDILTVLKKRFPAIPIVIYPAQVQGEAALMQLLVALEYAEKRAECDVLILARGGGAAEDLAVFNEEKLARRIFACTIPIVTGIGHEVDFTIADFVADLRAPTPSAAAAAVCPDREEISRQVLDGLRQLHSVVKRLLQNSQHHLLRAEKNLLALHPRYQLQEVSQNVSRLKQMLEKNLVHQVWKNRQHIEQLKLKLYRQSPMQLVQELKNRLEIAQQRFVMEMQNALEERTYRLRSAAELLHAVSPLATLSRGYAIARDEKNHILRNSKEVKPSQQITVRLHEGSLLCEVKEVR